MHRPKARHSYSLAGVLALAGLLAACAHREEAPPPAPPPAPPAAEAPAPPPPPPPPAAEAPGGWSVTAAVAMHAAPSTRSKIVGRLNPGDQVQATGKKTRVWTQVSSPAGE